MFIWKENITYYTKWLKEGFLPRTDIVLPIPYGIDEEKRITKQELEFIYKCMDRLVKENTELRSLHASLVCDDIYRMLKDKEHQDKNPDYYSYVKSFGNVLFLHMSRTKRAITLKDIYVQPDYDLLYSNIMIDQKGNKDIEELLVKFSKELSNRVMVIEGDAGVGKSSLVSYISFCNEKKLLETGEGMFKDSSLLCVRLRNLTMNSEFVKAPVKYILEELGFRTYEEFEHRFGKSVIFLDGFDELCMLDGMTEFAEHVLAEIIKGFYECHIIITSRPKFLDVFKLKENGINTGIVHVLLKHFDKLKRNKWLERYRSVCDKEEYSQLEKISMIEDENSEGICDTPLALYMLAAGKITEEAWNNPWVLYHQIFRVELSSTEYNKLFSKELFSHAINLHKDIIYKVSTEIAYKMYSTGNKKFYVTQNDVEEIISKLHVETKEIGQFIKRCYALCNYWKNDGERGIAEFYHNNIRDFFMCEKIFDELEKIYQIFDVECLKDDRLRDEVIEQFVQRFAELFLHSDLNDKVSEFIYYRSLHKMSLETEEEFIRKELKYQFLGYFFEKMFVCGGIYNYKYDGKRSVFQENINVLRCVVQIYRHIYEPYVFSGKKRLEWFFNADVKMSEMESLVYLFKAVFIRTPVTVTDDYFIPIAGYANFNLYDMKKADLRYGMFNYSKFLYSNFADTILRSTDFSNAVLTGCNFENADFSFSSLLGADISGCRFNNCNLIGTTLPDGFCSFVQEEQMEHISKLIE